MHTFTNRLKGLIARDFWRLVFLELTQSRLLDHSDFFYIFGFDSGSDETEIIFKLGDSLSMDHLRLG
jgi:hypothetical protein